MHWPITRIWLKRDREGSHTRFSTLDLSSYSAVCLLGGAGTGKSYEIEQLARHERESGREVRELSLGRSIASEHDLRTKLVTIAAEVGGKGAIFLDALDEAMIPLKHAAAVVEAWIDECIAKRAPRPALRVACRSAVWPGIVREAITRAYGDDDFISVELQPLTHDDIRTIANVEEIDPDAFTSALNAERAMPLAQQPITLTLLIKEFRSNGALPSNRRDLFDRGINRLVSERTERHERGTVINEPIGTIVDAAERIAIFCVMSGKDVIDLGENEDTSNYAIHALDLSCLESGNARALDHAFLRTIANTGLFVGDGDRTFRFFHRQIAEFLAGRRLASLPAYQARAILASDAGWDNGVAGPLRETAANTVIFSDDIAKWIARTDPEVFGLSDVADDNLRRVALQNLLAMFRSHRLTDAQLSRDQLSLEGLRHKNAEHDLQQVLEERGADIEDLHALAIELAEKWSLTRLSDALAELMLDDSVAAQTRRSAGYALLKVGSPEARRRTKVLVSSTRGEDDDLHGLALWCNWPDNLSSTELLSALRPPSRRSYYGAYQHFLYELDREGFDATGARIEGLAWARSNLTDDYYDSPRRHIAARIALASIQEMNDPAVCSAFVDLIGAAAEVHDEVFVKIKGMDGEELDSAAAVETFLREHGDTRRLLLDSIASREDREHGVWWARRIVPGLLDARDFVWLLERATDCSAPLSRRERYAQLAVLLPWREDRELVEKWLSLREHEPVQSVFRTPLAIELDSDDARRAKELHDFQRRVEPKHKTALYPPPAERIKTCLERGRDDPRWFRVLAREMTLAEYTFQRFITKTPEWQHADKETRSEIIELAKRLLAECDDIPKECHRVSLNSILGDGGMPAIFLLREVEPRWLEQQTDDWWSLWSWYILRELRPNLDREDDAPKVELIHDLHRRARATVQDHLLRLATKKDGSHCLSALLRCIEACRDDALDAAFCDQISSRSVRGDSLSVLMDFVLRRSPHLGVPACVGRLSIKSPNKPSVPAVRASVALLNERPGEAWDSLMTFFEKRKDLARHAIGRFAHHEKRDRKGVPYTLGTARIGQILTMMYELFPPEEDPKHDGAHYVSEHDSAVYLRNGLLNWLCEQEEETAVDVLRGLEARYGRKYPWLRRPRAEVERRHLLSQWSPIPIRSVAVTLQDAERRLVRSARDVVDGIMYALSQYENHLHHGNPPGIEDLWNTPRGQSRSPKDEERISDKVCEAIRETFERQAVTATRETQIRRRSVPKKYGGEPGSETDVLVSVPPVASGDGGSIHVVVEIKRSSNPEAKTGMRSQLVDRYLVEAGADHGVFVVAFLDTPNLAENHRPIWGSLDEAKSDLEKQAKVIQEETAGSVGVATFVLDARLM